MKTIHQFFFAVAMLTILSCNESRFDDDSSHHNQSLTVHDFLYASKPVYPTHTINGVTGGSFITAQGTVVDIPANAFTTQGGIPVTGMVTVEFKDIYKKSDMLLLDKPTTTVNGNPLKSGGEFFIKATFNGSGLLMAPGKKITVQQPAGLTGGVDLVNLMEPFVGEVDSNGLVGWNQPDSSFFPDMDSLSWVGSSYIFSLYNFSMPVDSGTWCNSDNSSYFYGYPLTSLTIEDSDPTPIANNQVYLFFDNISSMVHVYQTTSFPLASYTYSYAPQGLQCTAVVAGSESGQLYSSFTHITIGSNSTVSISMSATTIAQFIADIQALD
jgi:hypothetical protein